ncbi:MAG TPA: WXG100 family type VII secretion target [Chloroflexota bacterium]|nr:WXG100 family type VII secretion target [Chloroflexota bacterium]
MSADVVQARYEDLDAVAQGFDQVASASDALQAKIGASVEPLASGAWKGDAATRFLAEMQSEIFPALQRLSAALTSAGVTTRQVKTIIQTAEREASALFNDGAGPVAAPAAATSSGGGLLGGIGDFFKGAFEEGKDMVTGLWHMVAHPVDTAKGLWFGVTHPGEMWNALKKPYVDAWQSGHPWEAIGRGTLFAVSLVIGAKGADKVGEAAKLSRMAELSAAAAEGGARTGSAVNAATELGKLSKLGTAEEGLARYVAQQSTQTYGAAERIILGAYKPNPATNFLGYIGEAQAHGGTVFDTGNAVWNALKPAGAGTEAGWAVNRQFLQSALERGAPIELRGSTVQEILSNPVAARSFRGMEVDYLQRYAYEYGYSQVGETWVKTGAWRATTTGRAVGAAIGPAGEVVTATTP